MISQYIHFPELKSFISFRDLYALKTTVIQAILYPNLYIFIPDYSTAKNKGKKEQPIACNIFQNNPTHRQKFLPRLLSSHNSLKKIIRSKSNQIVKEGKSCQNIGTHVLIHLNVRIIKSSIHVIHQCMLPMTIIVPNANLEHRKIPNTMNSMKN